MSNPGVYVLSSGKIGPRGLSVVVEDNIGESIHLHIGSQRLDFSIKDFLLQSERLLSVVRRVLQSKGIEHVNFDKTFLAQILPLMAHAIDVRVEKRRLGDLRALTRREFGSFSYIVQPNKLCHTPAWKYINFGELSFKKYNQFKYHYDNCQNLDNLKDSIIENGYPYKDCYIILFGDQPYIRDGLNRATALAHLYGMNHVVDVQVIYFAGGNWRFRLARELTILPLARVVRYVVRQARNLKADMAYRKIIRFDSDKQN